MADRAEQEMSPVPAAGVRAAIRKVDPAGVESIDHLYAGCWIFHALGTKYRFPAVARHRFRAHWLRKRLGECIGQGVRRHALCALQFHHALPFPRLLQERSSGAANVIRGYHRDWTVQRLKVALDFPLPGRGDVPCGVLSPVGPNGSDVPRRPPKRWGSPGAMLQSRPAGSLVSYPEAAETYQ
jgi:hypothetical protein